MFPVIDGMQIVSEYVQGHMPASEIIEKYHLSSRQVLSSWMDRFVNEKEWVSYYKRNDNDFAEDAIEPLIVEKMYAIYRL